MLERLKAIVGPSGWTTDPAALEPHLREWRGVWQGSTPIMVSPHTTEQVAAVMAACAGSGTALVPQGGNTGLCGGAIPSGRQVLLSLARLDAIRSISPDDFSMVVEAGCILANVQSAAAEAGRYFPLSLAAEGSAQIGGNLSTNAGGINVLRYGTARNLVLGLEVVLADGSVWHGLRALRKDTAGYDLKQLFIGSEGTLGIITAATLRLFPPPRNVRTAMLALTSPHDAVRLLSFLRERAGDGLEAFELIQHRALALVLRHIPSTRSPFGAGHDWYVLLDASDTSDPERISDLLGAALERSLAVDAVLAKNETEAGELWRLRHSISEAQKYAGASLKHDVSVPIGRIGEFIERAEAAIVQCLPGARTVAFGHVGDGNVHFNVSQPPDWSAERFHEKGTGLTTVVYDLVAEFEGSISAEHGIGQAKKHWLRRYRGPVDLALMQALKSALDPRNLLNPGKVL